MRMYNILRAVFAVLMFSFLLAVALLSTSCNTQKVVTVTEYRDRVVTDTVEALRIDSIYVAHYVLQKGETVRITDTIFQYRIIHDTETKTEYVRDSIPYPVEVPQYIRKRNGYDRFTSWGFWILAASILISAAWWIFKTLYLRKQ